MQHKINNDSNVAHTKRHLQDSSDPSPPPRGEAWKSHDQELSGPLPSGEWGDLPPRKGAGPQTYNRKLADEILGAQPGPGTLAQ